MSIRNFVAAADFTTGHGRDDSRHWYGLAAYWLQRIALWPCPCLLAWTAALLLIVGFRSRGRSFGLPGSMACVAGVMAFVALGVAFPQTLSRRFVSGPRWSNYWRHWWVETFFALPLAAALAVSMAWLTLALGGYWHADRGWQDRLGRFLGGCWIVLGIARVLSSWHAVFTG